MRACVGGEATNQEAQNRVKMGITSLMALEHGHQKVCTFRNRCKLGLRAASSVRQSTLTFGVFLSTKKR